MSENIRKLNSSVPDNLKRILKRKGMKQSVFSKALGIPRQRITDIISGRRLVYPSEIMQMAKALDVSPNELFGMGNREIRIVRENDLEVIASITPSNIIYKEGYRVEEIVDN